MEQAISSDNGVHMFLCQDWRLMMEFKPTAIQAVILLQWQAS